MDDEFTGEKVRQMARTYGLWEGVGWTYGGQENMEAQEDSEQEDSEQGDSEQEI